MDTTNLILTEQEENSQAILSEDYEALCTERAQELESQYAEQSLPQGFFHLNS
jgi:hypothetical protein